MKEIFIITDNNFMYSEISKILKNKKTVKASFFCSPGSENLFKSELKKNEIKLVNLKKAYKSFIENYDMGISCHSKQIFPAILVNSLLCINVHPGLNPYNKGLFPHVFSIINGLPTGVTIHIMDEQIDNGEIIIQEKVEIYDNDDSFTLYTRIQQKEISLFSHCIDDIINGNFTHIKSVDKGNYNSLSDYQKLCEINLEKNTTMKNAINYLRAMTHPPYKNAYFINENGDKIYISINLNKEE